MKINRWRLFGSIGAVLFIGVVILGFYQVRWIGTATEAEERGILREIGISAERALEEGFDEIRTLISFAYVSPELIAASNWTEASTSIQHWAERSLYPELLASVMLVPTSADGAYLLHDKSMGGFTPVEHPAIFSNYQDLLSGHDSLEAFRMAYPELLREGYFMLPIFEPRPTGKGNGDGKTEPSTPTAILAVKIDLELLLSEIFPIHLANYLHDYGFKIVWLGETYFSNMAEPGSGRSPDAVVQLLNAVVLRGEANWPRRDQSDIGNPLTRFWYLRTVGIPGIDPVKNSGEAISKKMPKLEVYYPERSLRSEMRRRQGVSLALSIGTLMILLAGYFVLYTLLKRTDNLRVRERDFVTSMSHELRTPLSVISATSDNLVRGIVEEPERVKKYGSLISAQSQRLGKMVESILLYSGIETMDYNRLHVDTIDLADFFGELVASLGPAAEENKVKIGLSVDTRIESIIADSNALRIVAENLVVNAIRHGTQEGESEIRVIIRTRPPRVLLITVEDDGPGIDPADARQIFEAFARGERSKSEQVPGSGLGLHIVRRVCTQLGGAISLESPYKDMAGNPRRGARFVAKIPFRIEKKNEEKRTNSRG